MFSQFQIEFATNIFDELSKSTAEFENIIDGRLGANLIDYQNNLIPLVRTTTIYNKPPQIFLPIHYEIINKIKQVSDDTKSKPKLNFNNAMIEIYDSRYTKMGYHTDQSLDLEPDSYICIFSCYDNPLTPDIRKLKIKEKTTNNCSEFLLNHNSIVLFSLNTNSNHLHKIVLETNTSNTKWLGITFRLSKTFIQHIAFRLSKTFIPCDTVPYFYQSKKVLRLANKEEKKAFMKYKGIENQTTDYVYPEIDYTVSVGDTISI